MKPFLRNITLSCSAILLRNMLLLLSIPLFAVSCQSAKKQSQGNSVDTSNTVVTPPDTNKTQSDSLNPKYYNPETICDYGVIYIEPKPVYDSTVRPQPMYGVKPVVGPK